MRNKNLQNKIKIYILRGGAPDKFNYNGVNDSYEYLKLDHKNLVDLSVSEVKDIIDNGNYIVSGSEDDIWYANKFDSRNIILPNIEFSTIDKDSDIYIRIANEELSRWIYPEFIVIKNNYSPYDVVKAVRGSGSREVLVKDKELSEIIGKPFVSNIDDIDIWDLRLKTNCRLISQKKIPNLYNLVKSTANLVFRDGKLLGYVWTEVEDKTALTTNWNHGYHVCTEFTEKSIIEISELLLNYLTDGILNIDFHTDYKKKISWITEFNWRIGNNFFESTATGIDLFDKYIKKEKFTMPEGKHKFCRYWQCMYFEDNKNQM